MGAREEFWQALKELAEQIKKTDAEIDKLKERQEKTDEQLKKTDEQLKKTDEQIKKTDEKIKNTSKEIDKLMKAIHSVSDGYGRFVEGIISPSAISYFSKLGYKIIQAGHREEIYENGILIGEYDTILDVKFDSQKYLIVGEAKTHCILKDVAEFIKRLKKLKKIEKYKEYKIIGFIASINYGREADNFAITQGIYVFKVTDNVMKAKVPKNFTPKEF